MKRHRLLLVVALVALLSAVVGVSRLRADAPPVVINELLAGNASATLDPDYKNFVPWVELHNTGGSAVNLGGYRLTDDLDTPTRWIIPSGVTIPAGGYLILWLDGQGSGRHAPYVLGMSGELGLFMPDGTPVDTLTFGPPLSDVAYGRNGSGDWRYYDPATPSARPAASMARPKR